MVRALKDRVIVGAGGRIEIAQSDLAQGTEAEVIVLVEEPARSPASMQQHSESRPLTEFFGACRGMFNSAEEADAYVRELREDWERPCYPQKP